MSQTAKEKLLHPMSSADARERLLAIYAETKSSLDFMERYPGFFTWAEIWSQLRTRAEGLDAIAQAFAEKITRRNKHCRLLEQTIFKQRGELKKRLDEIEELRAAFKMATGKPYPPSAAPEPKQAP